MRVGVPLWVYGNEVVAWSGENRKGMMEICGMDVIVLMTAAGMPYSTAPALFGAAFLALQRELRLLVTISQSVSPRLVAALHHFAQGL